MQHLERQSEGTLALEDREQIEELLCLNDQVTTLVEGLTPVCPELMPDILERSNDHPGRRNETNARQEHDVKGTYSPRNREHEHMVRRVCCIIVDDRWYRDGFYRRALLDDRVFGRQGSFI